MPVKYRFDSDIVVVEMVGEYSMDELRAAILNSLADPERPGNSFLLINLTESQSIHERSSSEVATMARFVASLGKRFNNRIALVAPDDLPFGLMRMSSAGSEQRGIRSQVFRTLAEARKWLMS
ncbi:MAG: STAS/SEC14 domain-containing protein [Candidatus Kryptoniota bacterium]